MTDTLGLVYLYNSVTDRFAAEGTQVTMTFGWRRTAEKLVAGPSIVWVPGDEDGGAGEIAPPRNPGGNPRPLATLGELFTVTIQTADPASPENELAQYTATRLLFDAWYRASVLAISAPIFSIKSVDWITDKNLRRYGAALRIVCSIQASLLDAPFESVLAERAVVSFGSAETITVTPSE